jgi:hypothetical protein
MASEREILVRRHFEAYRDLVWIEDLEPKFRKQGIEGDQLQAHREAWNEHAERRDWAWWQKETAHTSSGRLEDEIMDITERLDQLGCLRWLEDRHGYDRMIAEAAARLVAKDNDKEIER